MSAATMPGWCHACNRDICRPTDHAPGCELSGLGPDHPEIAPYVDEAAAEWIDARQLGEGDLVRTPDSDRWREVESRPDWSGNRLAFTVKTAMYGPAVVELRTGETVEMIRAANRHNL